MYAWSAAYSMHYLMGYTKMPIDLYMKGFPSELSLPKVKLAFLVDL